MGLCCLFEQYSLIGLVVIFSLVAVYNLIPAFRFYVKSFVLYTFFIVNSVITCPFGLYYFKQYRKTMLFCCQRVDYISSLLGISWTVEKEDENWDKSKSYIIVCNHQSSVDTLGMMKIWSHLGHTVAIAKNELKYLGPFGLCLYLCGTIFLDRIAGEKGHKAINEASRNAKAEGTSIWIFPEGTRNRKRDYNLLPFKKGAFHMAVDNKLPILPVVISQYEFMDPKLLRFESGKATIKILRPIETECYGKENMQELIDKTRDTMCQQLKLLSAEQKKEN